MNFLSTEDCWKALTDCVELAQVYELVRQFPASTGDWSVYFFDNQTIVCVEYNNFSSNINGNEIDERILAHVKSAAPDFVISSTTGTMYDHTDHTIMLPREIVGSVTVQSYTKLYFTTDTGLPFSGKVGLFRVLEVKYSGTPDELVTLEYIREA